jgi:hypothetical protein
MKNFLNALVAVGAMSIANGVNASVMTFFGEDLVASSVNDLVLSTQARDQFINYVGSVAVEDFEDEELGGINALDFDGASIGAALTNPAGGFIREGQFLGRFPISGTKQMNAAQSVGVVFSAPVTAFGAFVMDANEVDNDTVTVSGAELTQEQIAERPYGTIDGVIGVTATHLSGKVTDTGLLGTFPALTNSNAGGDDGPVFFIGLVDFEDPIRTIAFVNGASGLDFDYREGVGFDDFMFSTSVTPAVPEPASTALLALGMLGAGFAGKQRRSRRAGDSSALRYSA